MNPYADTAAKPNQSPEESLTKILQILNATIDEDGLKVSGSGGGTTGGGAWGEITGTVTDQTDLVDYIAAQGTGGGSSVTVSETAPATPAEGDQWFNSTNGKTYLWYSSAWVEIGGAGVAGLSPTDTVTFGPTTVKSLTFSDTVWEDLRFPANGINPTGAADSPIRNTTTGMLEFSGTIDNVIAGTAQLPHAWVPGSTIRPHLHLWFTTSAPSNTRWKLEINRADDQTGFEVGYGSYTDGGLPNGGIITVANPQNTQKEVLAGWGDLPMTGYRESAVIMWKITRLAASDAADNHTSLVALLDVDFHYQIGKLGTDNELPE